MGGPPCRRDWHGPRQSTRVRHSRRHIGLPQATSTTGMPSPAVFTTRAYHESRTGRAAPHRTRVDRLQCEDETRTLVSSRPKPRDRPHPKMSIPGTSAKLISSVVGCHGVVPSGVVPSSSPASSRPLNAWSRRARRIRSKERARLDIAQGVSNNCAACYKYVVHHK